MLDAAPCRPATRRRWLLAALTAASLSVGCLANTGESDEGEFGWPEESGQAAEEELLLLEEALAQDLSTQGQQGTAQHAGQEASLQFAELLRERLALSERASDAGVSDEQTDVVVSESEIALDLSLALVHSLLDGGVEEREADAGTPR